jgi:hypothetical protein
VSLKADAGHCGDGQAAGLGIHIDAISIDHAVAFKVAQTLQAG